MATDTIQTRLARSHRRPAWRRRKLNTLIFFVTSHCNATCDTCFYWDELNRPGDLDWKEIVKLSESMPQLTDLWFSGGEPTLRRDLEDIIDLFAARNGVRNINLPTNGLKPQRIREIAERCLKTNPELELHVNIALDGLKELDREARVCEFSLSGYDLILSWDATELSFVSAADLSGLQGNICKLGADPNVTGNCVPKNLLGGLGSNLHWL